MDDNSSRFHDEIESDNNETNEIEENESIGFGTQSNPQFESNIENTFVNHESLQGYDEDIGFSSTGILNELVDIGGEVGGEDGREESIIEDEEEVKETKEEIEDNQDENSMEILDEFNIDIVGDDEAEKIVNPIESERKSDSLQEPSVDELDSKKDDFKVLSAEMISEIEVKTMFPESTIRTLHGEFLKYCSKFGTINKKGMLKVSYIANNPLKERIIEVMKFPKETNFMDFIESFGVFSKDFPQEDKLRFNFSLYDFDEDEFIGRKDMESFLFLLLGDLVKRGELTDVEVRKVVDFLFLEYSDGKSIQGLISYTNFKKLVQYTDFGVSRICFEY